MARLTRGEDPHVGAVPTLVRGRTDSPRAQSSLSVSAQAVLLSYLHQFIMPPVIIRLPKTSTSSKTTMTVPMTTKVVFVVLFMR